MLRKTVARAFGGQGREGLQDRPRPVAHRDTAIERLYRDLLEGFEALAANSAPLTVPSLGGEVPASSPASLAPGPGASGKPLAVTRPRPRAQGVEFCVSGPGGSFTFLNNMAGHLLIYSGLSATEGQALERLGVELRHGAYEPIRKPLASPGEWLPRAARSYRRTSATALVAEYAELAGCGSALASPATLSAPSARPDD